MLSLITGVFSGVLPRLIAAAVAVGGVVTLYLGIRRSGQRDQQLVDTQAVQRDAGTAKEVSDEVDQMSDADVDRRLRGTKSGQ